MSCLRHQTLYRLRLVEGDELDLLSVEVRLAEVDHADVEVIIGPDVVAQILHVGNGGPLRGLVSVDATALAAGGRRDADRARGQIEAVHHMKGQADGLV